MRRVDRQRTFVTHSNANWTKHFRHDGSLGRCGHGWGLVRSPPWNVGPLRSKFLGTGCGPFRALQAGELFLFKLHSPQNFIVGGGVFAYSNSLPCSLAWEAFGELNGTSSLTEMRQRILKYRRGDPGDRSDFVIGCRILTQPFFLERSAWIPVPESWSRNIVTFKTYDTSEGDGAALWNALQDRLARNTGPFLSEPVQSRYGDPVLVRPRLGQGERFE